jgi:hypothetical protein
MNLHRVRGILVLATGGGRTGLPSVQKNRCPNSNENENRISGTLIQHPLIKKEAAMRQIRTFWLLSYILFQSGNVLGVERGPALERVVRFEHRQVNETQQPADIEL